MRLNVKYTADRGYTVSVPNWDGGEVVTAVEHDLLREEVRLLKRYISGLEFNQGCEAAVRARQALTRFYAQAPALEGEKP